MLKTVALLIYASGCNVALTVFALRMAFGPERFLIRFTSLRVFGADVGAYIATLLYETVAWPIALPRWVARSSAGETET